MESMYREYYTFATTLVDLKTLTKHLFDNIMFYWVDTSNAALDDKAWVYVHIMLTPEERREFEKWIKTASITCRLKLWHDM